ncbi:MAG: S1 family peptidase [Phycisphaerae bacterium]|nr:S1 family peptidase [Phycisphaerae bacterium]
MLVPFVRFTRKAVLFAALICLVLISPAWGIVTDDISTSETAPSGDWNVNWDNVYNYKSSSAVAIDSHWILTAAHVADDGGTGDLTIGEVTYYQQEIVYHATADLALVRYDKAFSGYYDLYTGAFPTQPSQKLSAVMIGFGYAGEDHGTYYTATGGTEGTKRWGTNKIDGTTTAEYSGWSTEGIQLMFNSGDTPYEAGVATYDSGGGSFVLDDGVWKLAGINLGNYSDANGYVGTFAASMPEYDTWIMQTTPEPATLTLIGLGGVGLLLRRRRRRA